ncbi:hypothetical protein M0804_010215 [Polistes exclamans]|nr:hypothetical protein M0804_010215 [Polistes exclamans]
MSDEIIRRGLDSSNSVNQAKIFSPHICRDAVSFAVRCYTTTATAQASKQHIMMKLLPLINFFFVGVAFQRG